MGFIENFFRKKPREVTEKDLETFLTRKIEENLNLDYKDIQAYSDFDKLSKNISAFANSEGGLIILGISQDEIKKGKAVVKVLPKELTWGEETLSKETLEDNLVGKIQPPIDGIKIQPVRKGNGSMRVIFLIDIPQSKNRPHMASDKRYYKRLNFRKTPMEHFEIVDLLKVKWVLYEKMVEKIYEPLASILEKNGKEISNYQAPTTHEIKEILEARTYYRWQMPDILIEGLDDYIDQIEDLNKKEHFARRQMRNIWYKNIFECLKPDTKLLSSEPNITVYLAFENTKPNLGFPKIYELLIKNTTIKEYTTDMFQLGKFDRVEIKHDGWHFMELDEFDELIWKNCLKEAREDKIIREFKKSADALREEAYTLINDIITIS